MCGIFVPACGGGSHCPQLGRGCFQGSTGGAWMAGRSSVVTSDLGRVPWRWPPSGAAPGGCGLVGGGWVTPPSGGTALLKK